MTVLVGYSPQESGQAALELGVVLARSLDEPLVVVSVVATPHWEVDTPIDGDYRGLLRAWGERSLVQARSLVPPDVGASYEVREAGSIVAGLSETATAYEVSMVVLGSSAKGLTGRISMGSVIETLLHGSRWPLALAPRGYRAAVDDRIDRLTLLFSKAAVLGRILGPAQDYAARMDVSMRFAAFIVRPFKRDVGTVEPAADRLVVDAWAQRMRAELAAAVAHSVGGSVGEEWARSRLEVGDGLTWGDAAGNVPWRDGDLAVLGSAANGPIARVFLGSRASKIVRSVPVPVLLLPRT